MAQFQDEFLKDQEDSLRVQYYDNIYSGPDPDDDDEDDDWVDDDEDPDLDTDDDIDDDADISSTELDDDDDDSWIDDDEDFDEDTAGTRSASDETTEADRINRENLNPNFEERPSSRNRTTGRMIDHEPGSPG